MAERPLHDRIAVVTGASRGVGRGIACVLGEQGATVFVTGRSSRGGARTEDRAETVEETAELVTARGGRGIAVRCDNADDDEVAALRRRVEAEGGSLDLLVNNAWGGYEGYDRTFDDRFWRHDFGRRWDAMVRGGVRAHLLTTHALLPLMLARRAGLVVHTVWWNRGAYLGNTFYDVAKAAVVRFARVLALEVERYGIAVVAVAPGFTRTERVLDALEPDAPQLQRTESAEYTGRAVAALARDPDVMARSGTVAFSGELAAAYGFRDVDGRVVPPYEATWLACDACGGDHDECPRCFGLGRVVR